MKMSRKQGGKGEAGNSEEKAGNREERERQETVRGRKSRK